MELVPDSGFDDPGAWSFVGSGASVTGSQLRFANAVISSSSTIPVIVPVVGKKYRYSISVERYPASPTTARIRFAGVDIYNKDGAGVFSGVVTALTTDGLIFQSNLVGQWYLDDISIALNAGAYDYKREIVTYRGNMANKELFDMVGVLTAWVGENGT